MKTARPRIPSPLTGAIVVSLLMFKDLQKTARQEKKPLANYRTPRGVCNNFICLFFKLSLLKGEFKVT